jgi:hypothetical protein
MAVEKALDQVGDKHDRCRRHDLLRQRDRDPCGVFDDLGRRRSESPPSSPSSPLTSPRSAPPSAQRRRESPRASPLRALPFRHLLVSAPPDQDHPLLRAIASVAAAVVASGAAAFRCPLLVATAERTARSWRVVASRRLRLPASVSRRCGSPTELEAFLGSTLPPTHALDPERPLG